MAKTATDYARERREKGLCCSCGNQALPGEARCADHKEKERQRYLQRRGTPVAKITPARKDADAAIYLNNVLRGICPSCRKQPKSVESVYCLKCLEIQRERQRKIAAAKAMTRAAQRAELEASRKAAGTCIGCGDANLFTDDRCRECQASYLEREEKLPRYNARLQVGLCQSCPKVVDVGTIRCQKCKEKRAAKLACRV